MARRKTVRDLPEDHSDGTYGRHAVIAAQMRSTDDWVHIGTYNNRVTAQKTASMVRTSNRPSYRGHVYDARAITTADGAHQVWGRWIGPRDVRPTRTA